MTLSKQIFAASVLLMFRSTDAGARPPQDFDNPGWILGQVVYFAARCPELRTERVQEMTEAYCPHNRVAPADCEEYKATTFKIQADAGANRLKAEFGKVDQAQVCRAALDRYGPNGSQKPGMLSIRR
jgi:hypothetical protein